MCLIHPLFVALAFALAVAASPVVIRDSPLTLPLVRRLNTNGTFNLLARDQARVSSLRQFSRQRFSEAIDDAAVTSVTATNQAIDYVVSVSWLTIVRVLSLIYLE